MTASAPLPHGPLFRQDLDAIPVYVPGKTFPDAIKLSSNEVPTPPDPDIIEAITQAAATAHRYQDTSAAQLRELIAQTLGGLTAENIVVGNGSVSLLQHLVQAVCTGDGSRTVIMPWRSFEAYPIMAHVAGAPMVHVPLLPDGKHDLPALLKAAQAPDAGVVFLCNPNNPTGETFSHDELAEFMAGVPSTVIVALDEAYLHFVRSSDYPRSLELLPQYPNLVIFRTFSKAYGLASLRVGYLVAHPHTCQQLSKTHIPFATSIVAQRAAETVLSAPGLRQRLLDRTEPIVQERIRVEEALREMGAAGGWTVPHSEANFVWLDTPQAADLTAFMADHGVIVRGFVGDGVRITISTPQENTTMLEVAESWCSAMTTT